MSSEGGLHISDALFLGRMRVGEARKTLWTRTNVLLYSMERSFV